MSRVKMEIVEKSREKINPVFLNSPQYIHEPLAKLLGCNLVLKIETLNPIRSFKGRGSEWLVSQAKEDHLMCASAGNFGQAMAYSCRERNKKLTIYASTNANKLKVERMRSLGAEVILHGDDFDAAKLEAKNKAKENKIRFVEDSFDIETLEGAGTIALELLQFPEKIDSLIIPLGNGAMFNGIAKIFKERSPATNMIIVQAEGAPAMVESWKAGTMISHQQVNTIADGIAVRLPVPIALDDMTGLVDDAVLVKEESILTAMKLLHVHAGIVAEPSGAVGFAAILENKVKFEGKTVATIICGGNLTEEQIKKWL
jgi:threonine dehydratase